MKQSSEILKDLNWSGETVLQRDAVPLDEMKLESVVTYDINGGDSIDGYYLRGVLMVWCSKGELTLAFDNRDDVTLKGGDFAIVYPDHIMRFIARKGDASIARLILTGSMVEKGFDELGFYDGFVGREPMPKSALKIFEKSLLGVMKAKGEDVPRANAILMKFVYNYLTSAYERLRRQGSPIFFDAIKLFNADLETGLVRVKEVAQKMNVSTNTLHLAFANSPFLSPGAYITTRQVRLARRLLFETRLPMKEIAKKCGFQTSSHFTTFMLREIGQTPSEFRKSARTEGVNPSQNKPKPRKRRKPREIAPKQVRLTLRQTNDCHSIRNISIFSKSVNLGDV